MPVFDDTPTEPLLRRYLLGQTTDSEAELVERYLERHPELARKFPHDLVNDALLIALRKPVGPLPETQADVHGLIERLEKLAVGLDVASQLGTRIHYFGDYEAGKCADRCRGRTAHL